MVADRPRSGWRARRRSHGGYDDSLLCTNEIATLGQESFSILRTYNYAYDAENRLVSVTSVAETNGAIRVFNSYDYRHRRISKTVQRLSVTTAPPPSPPIETYEWNTVEIRTFAYDSWNLIHETVAAIDGGTKNTTEVQYFWGLDLSDSLQGAAVLGFRRRTIRPIML